MADDWPALMNRCSMDETQRAFYRAIWYAAGLAWARGVADEALRAVCDVTLRAADDGRRDER
jgi:hypothetical protein